MEIIITGGISTERDLSINSAKFVQKYYGDTIDIMYFPEELEKFLAIKDSLTKVIPVFHGEYGEDGGVFAFLKTLGIPTSFSDFQSHAFCIDKFKTNILVKSLGIKVPSEIMVRKGDNVEKQYIENTIGFPCILKPNNGGSSYYTYKVEDHEELQKKLTYVFENLDANMLICEYILGDEYSVSLADREVLPIMKIEKKDKNMIFDYESKYVNEDQMKETWPELSTEEFNDFAQLSLKIYDFFNLQGYGRIDFIKKCTKLYFLDINPIPGPNEGSILPLSWKKTGRSYEELIEKITKKV